MFELYVALTAKCNFKCRHCITSSNPSNNRWTVDKKERDQICKIVNEKKEIVCLHFSGGEPTIFLNKIEDIVNGINRKIDLAITTNGSLNKSMWPKFKEIGFDYISISFDLYHSEFANIENILEFSEFARSTGAKTNINVVFNSIQEIAQANLFKEKGFEINFSKLVHSGSAATLTSEFQFLEALKQGCPSMYGSDATSSGAKKIVYLPGEGYTWCCGPLAFDEKTTSRDVLSESFDLEKNEIFSLFKKNKSFENALSGLSIDLSDLNFASVCDLCSFMFKKKKEFGMESIFKILSREDENFYMQFSEINFDTKTQEVLSKKFRTSAVLTAEIASIRKIWKKMNNPAASRIVELDLSFENLEDVKEFTRKNFYETFKNHYTTSEIERELNGLINYFTKFNAKGKIGYIDDEIVSVLLYNDYGNHPALNKRTRHIGYWGYDSSLVSEGEAFQIKSSWVSNLEVGLSPESLVDCSIHLFNERSLRLAKSLGFCQHLWRFEKKNT